MRLGQTPPTDDDHVHYLRRPVPVQRMHFAIEHSAAAV